MKTTEEKLTVLAEIAACLNQAHLTWALGASAMQLPISARVT